MPKIRKLSRAEVESIRPTAVVERIAELKRSSEQMASVVDHAFPNLAAWVDERGWLELGANDYSSSFIRLLDIGGMVWEGATHYPSLAAALADANAALTQLEADGEL